LNIERGVGRRPVSVLSASRPCAFIFAWDRRYLVQPPSRQVLLDEYLYRPIRRGGPGEDLGLLLADHAARHDGDRADGAGGGVGRHGGGKARERRVAEARLPCGVTLNILR